MVRHKIIFPTVLALAILTVGILSTSVISAQEATTTYKPIIERLAERFGLNKDEVKKVFDESRDERRADRFAHFAERLNDMVADGKITEVQKEAILDKQEEMQAKIEELENLSPAERKAKMREIHEEMRAWAEDQGIKFPFIFFKGVGMHKGFGEKMKLMN